MASTFYLPAIKNILNSWKTRRYFVFNKKKSCIYAALGVSQTPNNYREMRGELGMKRSMRFAAVMIAAVMTVGTASTAMAAEWKHDSKGWWW